MNKEELEIYWQVKEWVKNNPELLPTIVKAATEGCTAYAKQCREDAINWETVAVAATSKRWHNDRLAFVKMKVEGLKERAGMCWNWLLEK